MPRPFRFAVQLSTASSREDWVDKARRAEDLGYSTLFMPDHFGDQFAPVPALMAAADATTTLRIGTLVLDNDYRHPLVLAKEAATLDLLSGGRLELGIGAGWMRSDYEQSGIAYDSPGTRIDRFEEGLAILKGLLAGEEVSFEGRFYDVHGSAGPRPAQQPHPPILIGGGARRMLTIAGREADIVSINFDLREGAIGPAVGATGTAELVDQKIEWVRDGAGDRFDEIELGVTVFVAAVTDDAAGLAGMLAGGFGLTTEQALEMPFALVGTVEQMVEALQARRERFGISYVAFSGDQIDAMAPVVAALADT